uniref:Uncharacterized protein n=1 Tax=Naja naja TaxID=35670 RepID=A0A8C6YHS2_NAJNA
MEDEEEVEEPKAQVKEVKMSTIVMTLFPTSVTEEKLQESKEKAITRIFGPAKTLLKVNNPKRAGDYESILNRKIDEHCQEGDLCFAQGEWEEAITRYTKALNLDPNKGQSLYEQKVYLDALDCWTHAFELQPQNTLYRMRSIACLAAMNRFNDCLQMVNTEVEVAKSNADLFVLRARLFEYFGKASCCFCNIQEALALDPDHVEARLLLKKMTKEAERSKDCAVTLAIKGNLKGALLKINRAINYNPLDEKYFLFRYPAVFGPIPFRCSPWGFGLLCQGPSLRSANHLCWFAFFFNSRKRHPPAQAEGLQPPLTHHLRACGRRHQRGASRG